MRRGPRRRSSTRDHEPLRSRSVVIPVLAYADVAEAADWLCPVFGFTERLRIGGHRAQLVIGDGAIIVTRLPDTPHVRPGGFATHSVHVRVTDARAHHEQAVRAGARILDPPIDDPYGERQYVAEDPAVTAGPSLSRSPTWIPHRGVPPSATRGEWTVARTGRRRRSHRRVGSARTGQRPLDGPDDWGSARRRAWTPARGGH